MKGSKSTEKKSVVDQVLVRLKEKERPERGKRTLVHVKPEYLQYYLTKTGWTKADYKKVDQIKYQFSSDEIFVLVPKSARSSDYTQSLQNIVRTISQLEEREESAVVKNILNPNVDVLKFRFLGSSADLGSLPLDYTQKAIERMDGIMPPSGKPCGPTTAENVRCIAREALAAYEAFEKENKG